MAEKEDYTKDIGETGPAGPAGDTGTEGPEGPEGPPGTTDYEELENVPSEFTPSAHAADHENGGDGEINVAGLSGVLAENQNVDWFEVLTQHGRLIGNQEAIGLPGGDLGQQAAETHVYSLAYLGNGIALAGSYPHAKILRSPDHGATWVALGQQAAETRI